MEKGYTLVSNEIRERIRKKDLIVNCTNLELKNDGKFVNSYLEGQIQPASFDPTIGDFLYELDTDSEGVFRPSAEKKVIDVVRGLGKHRYSKQDITDGYELKKGFTYLIPLTEKIILRENEYMKASPKSSVGRLFLYTRLLSDFNPCFDEVSSYYKKDKRLNLWLLVQPLAFNVVVYPGLSFNQIMFVHGSDVALTASEVVHEFDDNALLYESDDAGQMVPSVPRITDALQIHLDVKGDKTNGVVGLRARKKPTPIDMKLLKNYDVEEFFEPIFSKDGKVTIKSGEYYLFASKEVLSIPKHLSVELKSYSHVGISGLLHFAGFIDNNFQGDLVFEIRSDEISDVVLQDGMPISKLEIFRGSIPDKLYGKGIKSNYFGQVGPKPAKFFKKVNYSKLSLD